MVEVLTAASEKQTGNLNFVGKIAAWLAIILFACHASTHMVPAGDTWVALACGKHFVNHGVDTVEPFSANSHKAGPTDEQLSKWCPEWLMGFVKTIHPTGWINQNWLTHVLFYKSSVMLGSEESPNYNAMVIWKFALYILTAIVVFNLGMVIGADFYLAAISACLAMFLSRSFLDIRPAGFSNLFVPLTILVLCLAGRRNLKYLWFFVPLVTLWSNLHGGYLYAFIVLGMFFFANLIGMFFSRHMSSLGIKGLKSIVIVGLVSFVSMVIFNPYHLTNLTHTFIVTIRKNAKGWREVAEWHGAFDFSNKVGVSWPFVVALIPIVLIMLLWLGSWIGLMPIDIKGIKNRRKELQAKEMFKSWPDVDLFMIMVSLFTIFMAITSRRFIPIACCVSLPLVALMAFQVYEMFSSSKKYRRDGVLEPKPLSMGYVKYMTIGFGVVFIVWGGWVFARYDKVFNGPWGPAKDHDSTFMRMTYSHQKPFDACEFIRINGFKGNMFNYWTEGGFVAYSQDSDKDTGMIPLKLYMDGRAQAAYDYEQFKKYMYLIGGGPYAKQKEVYYANLKGAIIKDAKLKRDVGQWFSDQMRLNDVWILLVPKNQFLTAYMQGIDINPDWRMIFRTDEQAIYVDITSPNGSQALRDIESGVIKYPDDSFKNTVYAYYNILNADIQFKQRGLENAFESYKHRESLFVLHMIMIASGAKELQPSINKFAIDYLNDFVSNKDVYMEESGLNIKINAADRLIKYLKDSSPSDFSKLNKPVRDSIGQYEKRTRGTYGW